MSPSDCELRSRQQSRAMSPLPQQPQPKPSTMNRIANFYRRHPTLIGGVLGSIGTYGITKFQKPLGKFMAHTGDYMKRVGTNVIKAIATTPYRNPKYDDYDKEHKNTVNDKQD